LEVFETIMEKRQDQIPDEGSLMTKKKGVSKDPNAETFWAAGYYE
jgi:hypothetical protein